MRFAGFFALARMGLSALLRQFARLPVWVGTLIVVIADITDPCMPESIWQPREWLPRLWARTGGRTANEPRD